MAVDLHPAQLGLNTSRQLEKLLGHLGIDPPTSEEVGEVIRTRDRMPRLAPGDSIQTHLARIVHESFDVSVDHRVVVSVGV